MDHRAMLMFVVLTLCGTACILAALGAVTCLYHLHSVEMSIPPDDSSRAPKEILFAFFVGAPAAAVMAIGSLLVFVGIRAGRGSKES